MKYDDVLEGWKDGTSSGVAYTTQNMPGTVKSKGLELISKWKVNNLLNFNLNYTYTSTYDGAEADDQIGIKATRTIKWYVCLEILLI